MKPTNEQTQTYVLSLFLAFSHSRPLFVDKNENDLYPNPPKFQHEQNWVFSLRFTTPYHFDICLSAVLSI